MKYRFNITSLLAVVALLIVLFSVITVWILGNKLVVDINRITIEKRIAEIESHVEEWGTYALLSRQVSDTAVLVDDIAIVQGAEMIAVLDPQLNVLLSTEKYSGELPPIIDLSAKSGYILDNSDNVHRILFPISLSFGATPVVQFENEIFAEAATTNAGGSQTEKLAGFVVARIAASEQMGKPLLRQILFIFSVVLGLVVVAFLYAVNRLIGKPIRLLTREIEQGGYEVIEGLEDRRDLNLSEADKLSQAFARQHRKIMETNENLEATVEERTAELHQLTEELRQLAFRATHESDHEARRIAAEVHDILCSKILNLKNSMDMYHSTIQDDPVSANKLESYLEKLQILNDDARSIISRYRLHTTSYLGLEGGLDDVLQYVTASNPRISDLKFTKNSHQLGKIDSIAHPEIIKIVQEALVNINKHTEANEVELIAEDVENYVRIRIIDNGGGFDLSPSSNSHGLTIMRERANYIKGSIDLRKTPHGTEVVLLVPIGDLNQH